MNINSVVETGRLTHDPHLKHTADGTAICEFSIAVNEREKDSATGEWGDRASFFDVKVFGRQAESCGQYLAKGHQVGVSGRLRQDRWETKDNQKRSKVLIIAKDVQFLEPRSDDAARGQADYTDEFADASGF